MPLAIYLLTLAVAFSAAGVRRQVHSSNRALPLIALPIVLLSATQLTVPLLFLLPLHLVGFLVAALVCHCELAVRQTEYRRTSRSSTSGLRAARRSAVSSTHWLRPSCSKTLIEYPMGPGSRLRTSIADWTDGRGRDDPARWVQHRSVVGALAAVMCFVASQHGDPGMLLLPAFAGARRSGVSPLQQSTRGACVEPLGHPPGWAGFRVLSGPKRLTPPRTFFGCIARERMPTGPISCF